MTETTDLWLPERELAAQGYACICGVDEAGRGPLAGPVYAAAVILPFGLEIPGLNDSKKLSDARRRELFPVICEGRLPTASALPRRRKLTRSTSCRRRSSPCAVRWMH